MFCIRLCHMCCGNEKAPCSRPKDTQLGIPKPDITHHQNPNLLRVPLTYRLTDKFLGISRKLEQIWKLNSSTFTSSPRWSPLYLPHHRHRTLQNGTCCCFSGKIGVWAGKNVNESVISGENFGADGAKRVKWPMGYDFRRNGLFIAINDNCYFVCNWCGLH